MAVNPRLSIGPIQYFWPRQQVFDFYAMVADSAAEVVCLGEVVCSKRRELARQDWIALGRELEAAGKEVVLSTLTLLEARSELSALARDCEESLFLVEANDLAAVSLLSRAGKPFATGPSVNIYNARTLALLGRLGLRRWVLPVELGLAALRDLQPHRPAGVETELFAFGRLPLAWSARCYTARAHDLPKDQCGFRCLEDPDGRLLETREGEPFLVLNGVQTQSARTHHALGGLRELGALGVDLLRLSPQPRHFDRVIEIFSAALSGGDEAPLAGELETLLASGGCNGYLNQKPGMVHEPAPLA